MDLQVYQIASSIVAVILYVAALLWNVDRHYKKWRYAQGQPNAGDATPIKHKTETLIRLAVLIPSGFAFWFPVKNLWIVIFMMFCLTWFLFSGLFNTKRGKEWFFIGTKDKDESHLDNLKRNIGLMWPVLQIALAITSVVLYLVKLFS